MIAPLFCAALAPGASALAAYLALSLLKQTADVCRVGSLVAGVVSIVPSLVCFLVVDTMCARG